MALADYITRDVWMNGRFARANTRLRMWCSVELPPDDLEFGGEEGQNEYVCARISVPYLRPNRAAG